MEWASSPAAGPIVSALIGAVSALLFGLVQTRLQRRDELRRRRMDVYMAFCGAALEYRRAVLNQWDVRARLGGKEPAARAEPAVGEDVRATRAAAWARYYEVLILSSPRLVAAAHAALQGAADITDVPTRDERRALGTEVHQRIGTFAQMAARSVRTPGQALRSRPSGTEAGSAGTQG